MAALYIYSSKNWDIPVWILLAVTYIFWFFPAFGDPLAG
jgi:hypothetical protein